MPTPAARLHWISMISMNIWCSQLILLRVTFNQELQHQRGVGVQIFLKKQPQKTFQKISQASTCPSSKISWLDSKSIQKWQKTHSNRTGWPHGNPPGAWLFQASLSKMAWTGKERLAMTHQWLEPPVVTEGSKRFLRQQCGRKDFQIDKWINLISFIWYKLHSHLSDVRFWSHITLGGATHNSIWPCQWLTQKINTTRPCNYGTGCQFRESHRRNRLTAHLGRSDISWYFTFAVLDFERHGTVAFTNTFSHAMIFCDPTFLITIFSWAKN